MSQHHNLTRLPLKPAVLEGPPTTKQFKPQNKCGNGLLKLFYWTETIIMITQNINSPDS